MKTFKTRHQLFLTEPLSKRLEIIARNSGRARSEILVEALEAWFERREAPTSSEAILARMTRIERSMDRLRHSVDLLWEGMSRLIKGHMLTAADLPPPTDAARAMAAKAHANFINDIATRLADANSELAALDAKGPVQ